ncbi:hypothetical protein RJ640_026693 [Escallonia rubra]|uniref:Reverse transcriptase Ty1/copia-type domain-containing protein n=1 Tax=Escallonia rubra TaxID=112253 RepID=A0AA88RHA1_9ASTE|nr:hypothetical protein RJ640_026693 [Escallonia rubra]
MSMMRELTFFLGLQIKQSKDEIFINQAKYTKELLKRFDMEASNAFDTPMSSSLKLDKDEKGKDVDIKRYRDTPEQTEFKKLPILLMVGTITVITSWRLKYERKGLCHVCIVLFTIFLATLRTWTNIM